MLIFYQHLLVLIKDEQMLGNLAVLIFGLLILWLCSSKMSNSGGDHYYCLAVLIFDMLGNFALRSKEAKHMLIFDQHQHSQAIVVITI